MAVVFAVIMPLVLLAVIAAPLGLARAIHGWRSGTERTTTAPGADSGATAGEAGLGDPYYPDAGSSGYDVTRYQLSINWDPTTQSMTSTAVISARADHELRSFFVDLALKTDRVFVDGRPATFATQGFADVEITPATPVAAGADFQVSIDYSGKPGSIKRGTVTPWWRTNAEWTVAGEPEASAWWFPANDHPSDPALMDVSIRVPAGMEAISGGRLESADSADEPDFDTWHWVARQPMPTFAAFIAIGQFELAQGVDQGLPYVYAVSEQLDPDQRTKAMAALRTSVARVKTLESMFGPYPFTEIGGVVPAHDLWFDGLETQTRPVYQASSITDERYAPDLVTHELAHMWFGDHVSLRQWDDIFNSEAYASWAYWSLRERTGGTTATEAMNRTYDRVVDNEAFWRITMIDPGRDHLFDAVYLRGPMALQGLRNVIGDDAFFALARDWAQAPGPRSLEQWLTQAQTHTTVDLGPFFAAWIYGDRAPDRTAANGFR